MRTQIVAVISSAILLLAPNGRGQQNRPTPRKVLTPEQQAYRQWDAHYRQLQTQGQQIFNAEMVREKAGDCPKTHTTVGFNDCYGKQLEITEANLKSFEATIHDLLIPPPRVRREVATPQQPGLSGSQLTDAQLMAEFGSVEQSWRQYRDAACTAAYHQFDGGSGASSFEIQCRIQLARDHMRELRLIYGESFL